MHIECFWTVHFRITDKSISTSIPVGSKLREKKVYLKIGSEVKNLSPNPLHFNIVQYLQYPFPGHWEIPMLKVEELLNKFPLKHVLFYY